MYKRVLLVKIDNTRCQKLKGFTLDKVALYRCNSCIKSFLILFLVQFLYLLFVLHGPYTIIHEKSTAELVGALKLQIVYGRHYAIENVNCPCRLPCSSYRNVLKMRTIHHFLQNLLKLHKKLKKDTSMFSKDS